MGQLVEYIKLSVNNIRANKGRSFLTMLGIIIGIASVITIISIGTGLKEGVMSSTSTQSVFITVDTDEITHAELITWEDLQAIREQLDERILGVVASSMTMGTVTERKGTFDTYVTLTTSDAEKDPQQKKVIRGEYFKENDILNAEPACVLDKSSALSVFGTIDVVGLEFDILIEDTIQTVWIKGVRDEDQKMLEATQEAMSMFGIDASLYIELPYTVSENWGEKIERFSTTEIYLVEGEDENAVIKSAIQVLSSRHRNDGENLFTKQQSIDITSIGSVLDMITAFISFVAGISLLVGGIGVMNIMLVSVSERTREIGIRRAIGAKRSSIIIQFLCESAIISGTGGLIGVAIGTGIVRLISASEVVGFSVKVSPVTVIFATIFSCGVGIIFGIYPAEKAAKMNPIEALRKI